MGAVSEFKYLTRAGWDDVPHLSEPEKKFLMETTPAYLINARRYGEPVAHVGRIYPWDFARITIDPIRLHDSWPRVYGFDPSTNNTAALWGCLDDATDTLYLYGEYYRTHNVPRLHAQSILLRGNWIPGMCDPSAEGKVLGGKKVIETYKEVGLKTLRLADNAITAGLNAITDRVTTGRLKAFSTLGTLRFEWNNYRRDKKGVIVKENNHLLDCLRYICLGGLRWAAVKPSYVEAHAAPSYGGIADERAGF